MAQQRAHAACLVIVINMQPWLFSTADPLRPTDAATIVLLVQHVLIPGERQTVLDLESIPPVILGEFVFASTPVVSLIGTMRSHPLWVCLTLCFGCRVPSSA
jgi:hypothetical protein